MPVRLFFCTFTLALISRIAVGQTYFGSVTNSTRSISLGRSDAADVRDDWNADPALRYDTASNLRVVFSPEPVGIAQTYSAGISGDIPLSQSWTAGAEFSLYQWNSTASYESLGAQISKTFDIGAPESTMRHATAGVRLRYSELSFGQSDGTPYLPINDLSFDMGASFDIMKELTLAVAGTHIATISNNQGLEFEFPTALLGFSYRATSDFTVDAAFESSNQAHPEFHFGAEYALDENVFVRAGDDLQMGFDNTNEIMAGLGVKAENFSLDFAANRHSDLGTFVSFAIGFAL